MKPIPLWIPFGLSLFTVFFGGALLPSLRVIPFAPFFAFIYMRKSIVFSLWIAAGCGLLMDLLSSQNPFGLFALNYSLGTVLLYKQKRHFFDDKPLALSLFTALISCAFTFLQLFLLYAFSQKLPLSWRFLLSDLFAMPLLDALYAFLWFTCPIKLYAHIQRVGWRKVFSWKEEVTE